MNNSPIKKITYGNPDDLEMAANSKKLMKLQRDKFMKELDLWKKSWPYNQTKTWYSFNHKFTNKVGRQLI